MKNTVFWIYILMFSIHSLAFSQGDYKKMGCKYVNSKYKVSGFTQEQLDYAEQLLFRSDTFDIVNYSILLDVTHYGSKELYGRCDIDFAPKMEGLDYIVFDLLNLTVDSVFFKNRKLNYHKDSLFLKVDFDTVLTKGDTFTVRVFYHGIPVIDPSGFGGFYFENGYAFNLGIGLASIPHNYGRAWFPCFDNFVERSTFDFHIITASDHYAYCSGDYKGVDTLANGRKIFHYRMSKQIPTYLAGVAASDYREVNWNYEGMEKNIPIKISAKPQDIGKVPASFAYLPAAVEALEYWYGPYRWNRIGYVLTSHGAMEHATNIAFLDFLGSDGDPEVTMGVMAHELAHHWWGNVTTLTTAYDMWIKEGNSEYGWHLFVEHFFGKDRFIKTIKANQLDVISKAHIDDKGFYPLSGMPMNHTYGTTTYNKGAAVMHNLRSYMGDSLYRVGLQSILEKYAFSHLDAAQFQAQLETATGLDLSCFFDDWIYAPGFSSFEVDSVDISRHDGKYAATLFIEQKLYHAPHFHCDVPLEVSFYDEDMNKIVRNIKVSGQYSKVEVRDLPFKPWLYILNEGQKLNNGKLGKNFYLTPGKKFVSSVAKMSVTTDNSPYDSLFLRLEHTWGPPDIAKSNEFLISQNHYWTFYGKLPEHNEMKAIFYYNGKDTTGLDFDLTGGFEEDSIMVFYRPNAYYDWYPVPFQKKIKGAPHDGRGRITITGILPGQYAFGKILSLINIPKVSIKDKVKVWPVPAGEYVHIQMKDENSISNIEIFNITGQKVLQKSGLNEQFYRLNISDLQPGIYFMKIKDGSGKIENIKIIKN